MRAETDKNNRGSECKCVELGLGTIVKMYSLVAVISKQSDIVPATMETPPFSSWSRETWQLGASHVVSLRRERSR